MPFDQAHDRKATELGDIEFKFVIFRTPKKRTMMSDGKPVKLIDDKGDFVFNEDGSHQYATEDVFGSVSIRIPVLDQFGDQMYLKPGDTKDLTEEELSWLLTAGQEAKTRWAEQILQLSESNT